MMAGGGILLRYLLLLAAASSAGGRVAGWNGSGAAFTRLGCLRGGAALEDPADIFYAGVRESTYAVSMCMHMCNKRD